MSELISVTVAGGKYTIQEKEAYRWECLRYGEPWPAYEGTGSNNLEIALAHEVDRLKKHLQWIVDNPTAHPANMVGVARDGLKNEE